MRQIYDRLYRALELPVSHFINQNCKNYGGQHGQYQFAAGNNKCIAQRIEEIIHAEQIFKPVHAYKFLVPEKSFRRNKPFKSHFQANQRYIGIHCQKNETRKKHKMQRFILQKSLYSTLIKLFFVFFTF